MKRVHYTADIKIERVERECTTTKSYNEDTRRYEEGEALGNREVIGIARLTFTEPFMETMAEKIAAHITLISDGEAE